jgi:mono/diheme cytochrome c family protein
LKVHASGRSILLWAVGLAIAVQFVPIAHDNPPVPPGATSIPAPAPVLSILQRSCGDCHANTTTWPWYSHVAPVSWLIARDVHEGRRRLNLESWSTYSPAEQHRLLTRIPREVLGGDMPPWYYTPLHSGTRLTDADAKAIVDWAEQQAGTQASR